MFDLKKFKDAWGALSPLLADAEEWLEKSYVDPALFWNDLSAIQKQLSPSPVKSELGVSYNFYHDCVLRHPQGNRAFVSILGENQSSVWTYEKIHRCVNHLIKEWASYDLVPQQLIVLVLPMGIELLVALLASLRLGLTFCFLPPSSFLPEQRIDGLIHQIKPSLVVSCTRFGSFGSLPVPIFFMHELLEAEEGPQISHSYSSDEVVQRSLALHLREAYAWVPLEAHTVYLHALRDGLCFLDLGPGVTWAAPLACPLRSQPWGTLTTLLAGATYLHVSDAAIRMNPFILKEERVQLLGVSRELLKVWSKVPGCPVKQLKQFYLSPLDRHLRSWSSFVELNKLEKVHSFQAWIDNSMGGIVLVSQVTRAILDAYVKPPLGAVWSFKQEQEEGALPLKDFGVFSQELSCKGTGAQETNYLFAYFDRSCLLSATLLPCREGVTVPVREIEGLVKEFPHVLGSILHSVPKMGEITHCQLILLLFTVPFHPHFSEEDLQQLKQKICESIANRVGSPFVPDLIEAFPLMPKMRGAEPDRAWCLNEYRAGGFAKKKNLKIYQLISSLKFLSSY